MLIKIKPFIILAALLLGATGVAIAADGVPSRGNDGAVVSDGYDDDSAVADQYGEESDQVSADDDTPVADQQSVDDEVETSEDNASNASADGASVDTGSSDKGGRNEEGGGGMRR